ncbi:pyridoxamine 5'-phosphate oxidase [Cytophagaceae bacterium DM2B3-1]|uniref:Pyridoxine/pyridoxamine 5'-phosphate oxidase n=1 Tax=Xanthocytophaga flava TaxID=3048013 RepID=A0AAE3U5U6_9BACT|nr:pyridoxamine 5'-phosphate oxidase [Xanthocytophaga flavus]MDJ1480646.1 pyridoxamine 5'-phosphate oxidase [Xanthocytophaga flavus]MDJ1493669.1 pyridoxamine 5'-phosphate oxidase [Xanthocytophaga flavus]
MNTPLHSLADIRKEYTLKELDITTTSDDPFAQFQQWFNEAIGAKVPEPNAMHLATVSADGHPSGRIVLLKGLDSKGFTFFTNYESRKGQEMKGHEFASLTFFWPELERQLRIEGHIEKVSDTESDIYFQSRPRGSQIGAWASPQSTVIESRDILAEKQHQLEEKFGTDQPIPRPPHWGGYRLLPHWLEFWQGRPSRLHDRIVYKLTEDHSWIKQRLAP